MGSLVHFNWTQRNKVGSNKLAIEMWKMNKEHNMKQIEQYTSTEEYCFVHLFFGFWCWASLHGSDCTNWKLLLLFLLFGYGWKGFELRKKLYIRWAADMNYTKNANKLKSFT